MGKTHGRNTTSPLIISCFFFQQEDEIVPNRLNLIHQPKHVSVWRGRGGEKDIIHGSLLVISQWKMAFGPVKWIQTLLISQNYVSPLWHCTKSKRKSLICCIDSHSSAPPFHTYGACPSLTKRYATLGPCHMAYCVAYSNSGGIWKLTVTNERARGRDVSCFWKWRAWNVFSFGDGEWCAVWNTFWWSEGVKEDFSVFVLICASRKRS